MNKFLKNHEQFLLGSVPAWLGMASAAGLYMLGGAGALILVGLVSVALLFGVAMLFVVAEFFRGA